MGNPPSTEIIKRQPKWGYYVIWAGMVRNTLKKQYEELYNDSHVLCQDDVAYWNAIAPYRTAAGLPPIPVRVKQPVNFTGQWIFSEEKSQLDNSGTGGLPYKMSVVQNANDINVERTMISEYADNTVTVEKLTMDGKEKEFKAPFGNRPRMVSARLSEKGDTLFIDSKITFTNAGRTNEWITNEAWTLKGDGNVLSITQTSATFRGKRQLTAIFEKK